MRQDPNWRTKVTLKSARRDAPQTRVRQKSIGDRHEWLQEELQRLQYHLNLGHEVSVRWLPGQTRFLNGQKLAEEVQGNTILIYVKGFDEAVELLRHGFLEWVLNQHTKSYRQLINKLITLFEDQHYAEKERLIDSLTKLI